MRRAHRHRSRRRSADRRAALEQIRHGRPGRGDAGPAVWPRVPVSSHLRQRLTRVLHEQAARASAGRKRLRDASADDRSSTGAESPPGSCPCAAVRIRRRSDPMRRSDRNRPERLLVDRGAVIDQDDVAARDADVVAAVALRRRHLRREAQRERAAHPPSTIRSRRSAGRNRRRRGDTADRSPASPASGAPPDDAPDRRPRDCPVVGPSTSSKMSTSSTARFRLRRVPGGRRSPAVRPLVAGPSKLAPTRRRASLESRPSARQHSQSPHV